MYGHQAQNSEIPNVEIFLGTPGEKLLGEYFLDPKDGFSVSRRLITPIFVKLGCHEYQ